MNITQYWRCEIIPRKSNDSNQLQYHSKIDILICGGLNQTPSTFEVIWLYKDPLSLQVPRQSKATVYPIQQAYELKG